MMENGKEKVNEQKKGHGMLQRPPSSWLMNHRALPGNPYVPTDVEHVANVLTHGLLVFPSLIGMWWMYQLAADQEQSYAALIYGAALFFLFTISTTFHSLSYSGCCGSLKNVFHIGDRAVIYIFIAASYTPWLMLKDYHDNWSEMCLWIVWTAAVAGIIYQYTFHEQYKALETFFYLIISILPSIVIIVMKESSGLYELSLGGIIYIAGVVFFKCDGIIPFAHAIWHCFVTVGASVHFLAVCKHLLGKSVIQSE